MEAFALSLDNSSGSASRASNALDPASTTMKKYGHRHHLHHPHLPHYHRHQGQQHRPADDRDQDDERPLPSSLRRAVTSGDGGLSSDVNDDRPTIIITTAAAEKSFLLGRAWMRERLVARAQDHGSASGPIPGYETERRRIQAQRQIRGQ